MRCLLDFGLSRKDSTDGNGSNFQICEIINLMASSASPILLKQVEFAHGEGMYWRLQFTKAD
jgi:hypothetical protein